MNMQKRPLKRYDTAMWRKIVTGLLVCFMVLPFLQLPSVSAQTVTRRIEAENYNRFTDRDEANKGDSSIYTETGPDIYTCDICSNSHMVGDFGPDEWLEYDFTAPVRGFYIITMHVATPNGTSFASVGVDNAPGERFLIRPTGSYRTFSDENRTLLLEAGQHRIRFYAYGPYSFDFWDITLSRRQVPTQSPVVTPSPIGPTETPTVPATETPTALATITPRPTETLEPTELPEPTETPTLITTPESTTTVEPSVTAEPTPSPELDEGLYGVYFDGLNFERKVAERVDPTINFNWGLGSPLPALGNDTFSVRWTGSIYPRFSEDYALTVLADNGVRLWVNDRLIIDSWGDQPLRALVGHIQLQADQDVPIRLEFFEGRGDAAVVLSWQSRSQTFEVVPSDRLIPDFDQSQPTETPVPTVVLAPTLTAEPTEVPTETDLFPTDDLFEEIPTVDLELDETVEPTATIEEFPTAETPTEEPTEEPSPTVPIDETTGIWQRWEKALTSTAGYGNPYTDVSLQVIFTGPNGELFSTSGFWDGGNTFRIRTMFPRPGIWRWVTLASNTGDSGLHNVGGTVLVKEYTGTNALYLHGRIRVGADRRYLIQDDGTPFLWMGDDAGAAMMQASDEEWQQYVTTRAAQGFSVIQVLPSPTWYSQADRYGNRPFLDDALAQINPAYWQDVDRKVQYANEHGIVIFFVGVANPRDDTLPYQSKALNAYVRQFVARMHGSMVIYSPSSNSVYSAQSSEVALTINTTTSMHLITQYVGSPRGQRANNFATAYFDDLYLDFGGNQIGDNNGDRSLVAHYAITRSLELAAHQPTQPVITLEGFYDSDGFGPGSFSGNAYDARSTAYWSWLSGSLGYSYGTYGVRSWNHEPDGRYQWGNAMWLPSGTQMGYMAGFLRSIPWWQLTPAHQRVINASGDWTQHAVMAASVTGDLGVAYLPIGLSNVNLDMSGFARPMQVTWYNPVTNERIPAGTASNAGVQTFTPPAGGEDWVILFNLPPAPATPTPGAKKK